MASGIHRSCSETPLRGRREGWSPFKTHTLRAHTHTHTRICTHAYAHTHTHTDTKTHTQTHNQTYVQPLGARAIFGAVKLK